MCRKGQLVETVTLNLCPATCSTLLRSLSSTVHPGTWMQFLFLSPFILIPVLNPFEKSLTPEPQPRVVARSLLPHSHHSLPFPAVRETTIYFGLVYGDQIKGCYHPPTDVSSYFYKWWFSRSKVRTLTIFFPYQVVFPWKFIYGFVNPLWFATEPSSKEGRKQ